MAKHGASSRWKLACPATFLLLVACDPGRSDVAETALEARNSASAARTVMSPFEDDSAPIVAGVQGCVGMEFDLEPSGHAFARSAIRIENRCPYPVAVLTAPAEVRIRRTTADRFPEQSLLTAVNATFYVATREVGLTNDMFMGDGGKAIYSPPHYVSIQRNAVVSVPIIGAEKLFIDGRPGERELALEARIVPLSVYQPHTDPFDLTLDAATFNRKYAEERSSSVPVRVSSHVQEIGAGARY